MIETLFILLIPIFKSYMHTFNIIFMHNNVATSYNKGKILISYLSSGSSADIPFVGCADHEASGQKAYLCFYKHSLHPSGLSIRV